MTKKIIKKNPSEIYEEIKELIIHNFCIGYIQQTVGEIETYNTLLNFSYEALENYSIIQIWKLFDHKSVGNLQDIVNQVSNPEFSEWFDNQIRLIENDVKNLNIWRHNFVGHQLQSKNKVGAFQKRFGDVFEIINNKIKPFLFLFLYQTKLVITNTLCDEKKQTEYLGELSEELQTLAISFNRDKDSLLKTNSLKF